MKKLFQITYKRYASVQGVLILALLCFNLSSNASDIFFLAGGREAGLANSAVSLGSTWSVFHNPAGIVSVTDISFGFSHQNYYMIKELNTTSFAGVLPVKFGSFGVSGTFFGSSNYNEQKYAFGYSRSFAGKLDVGILCDYFTTKLPEEYDASRALVGEIGLIAHPIENLSIGCHLFNPSAADYSNSYGDIPIIFRAGSAWETKKYLLSAQVQANNKAKPVYSAGSEINLIENLAIRVGISTQDNMSYTCGIGYRYSGLKSDFAIAHHPVLGYSAFLSFEFTIRHS